MICLDTAPLIWGVQLKSRAAQQHMVERTARYIAYLRLERTPVVVPSPALAEFLVGVPAAEREAVLRELGEGPVLLRGFDPGAAALAAELESDRERFKSRARALAGREGVTVREARQFVRVDAMIAAIAIQERATTLVTGDPTDFEELLTGRGIRVIEVPDVVLGSQGDLPMPPPRRR